MVAVSRSAWLFLERSGLAGTGRLPMPRMAAANLRVRDHPADYPLPLPVYSRAQEGSPPPDRSTSKEWPHPREADGE